MENFLVVPLELLDSRASDMSQGLTPPEVNIVCLDLMGKKILYQQVFQYICSTFCNQELLKDGKERPNCPWVMFRATDHRGSINSFLTRLCRCSLSVLSTNKLKDKKCPISNPVSFPRVINGRLLFNNRFSGRFTLSVQFPKPTKSRARFRAEDSLCQINPPTILIFFFV